jgi:serine/threonine-protein kinase RsbW
VSISLAVPLQGPVSLNLPFSNESAGEVRRALVSWLTYHGSPRSVIDDAQLVATELVSNAIRHADPLRNSTLLVRWHLEGPELLLTVSDGGGLSRPEVIAVPPESESGRGLAIVEALSLRWRIEHSINVHAVHVHLALA